MVTVSMAIPTAPRYEEDPCSDVGDEPRWGEVEFIVCELHDEELCTSGQSEHTFEREQSYFRKVPFLTPSVSEVVVLTKSVAAFIFSTQFTAFPKKLFMVT